MNHQALVAVCCCFLLAAYVHATEWSCASSANTGTLIRSTNCAISGNNHVAVINTLEIVGSNTDMSNLITITAANNQRHFYINGVNNKLVLRYIKLTGGDVSSYNADSAKVGGSILLGEAFGQANVYGGELHLYSSILFNNSAGWGGGIYGYGNSSVNVNVYVEKSSITKNSATSGGGGIMIVGYGTAVINRTLFDSNSAENYGGALDIARISTVTLRQCTFVGNTATTNGNVIATYDSPTISMINTYLDDPSNNNNFNEAGTATTWNTCTSTNPCTENPFTGTCSAVDSGNAKLGVICPATCLPYENYYPNGVIAGCSVTKYEWNCDAGRNEGSAFVRSSNCTISGTSATNGGGIVVSNTLEIVGNNTDMNNLITITAANNQRHFYLNNTNAKLILHYLKLVGGDVSSYSSDLDRHGGSIIIYTNGGELNLYSSIVFNNKAKYGGGISAYGASNTNKNAIMNIYNSIIHNNEATNDGGGINMHYAVGTIYHTTIDNNQASLHGGGMAIVHSDVTMKNTTISNNNNPTYGGGFYIQGDSTTVTLRQSSFINNDASNGDEIEIYRSPTISLINTYFNNPNNNNNIYLEGSPTWKTCLSSNSLCTEHPFNGTCSAVDSGDAKLGVICPATCLPYENYYPNGVIAGCSVTKYEWNCEAGRNEGGAFVRSSNCTISGTSTTNGGGIVVSNTLEIVGSNTNMENLITITAANNQRHFYINDANAKLILRYLKLVGGDVSSYSSDLDRFGGSILIYTNGELNLYSSIVFNNKGSSGGGISAWGASSTNKNAIMNIYNSIIQNNEATKSNNGGGGIRTLYAVGYIYNTTIGNNQGSYGGGMYIYSSDVTMKNTIISNNDAGRNGGGLYIQYDSNVTPRQSSFINNILNDRTTYNGDEIFAYGSPTISLINTYFNSPNNNNNIYEDTSSGTTTWKTCSNNLCTENPFNGTCSAVDSGNPKIGVQCQATCLPYENYYPNGVIAGCSVTKYEWNCEAGRNEGGAFVRSSNCTISGTSTTNGGGIVVSNTLEIVGNNTDMNNLIKITAANNQRHFYLNDANAKLIVRYLKLVGGDVSSYSSAPACYGGSILIYNNGGELNLYSSIVFNNKAKYGGGIMPYDIYNKNERIMNIYNSIINNNEALYNGGGVWIGDDITVTIRQSSFINNDAGNNGGGLYIRGNGNVIAIRQSSFINNDATNNGDEIYTVYSPTISLINIYFNNPNNNNNIYEDTSSGTTTWKTCSNNLCTENPFNGTCSAVDSGNPKLGVICTCNRGKYYNFTTKKCIDCPIGKYGNISNSCALCPNGRYANITGISTECFGCPHGMYGKSDKIGATSTFNGCENCSSGTYGNVTGAETEPSGCFLCAFGKYSNKIGATNCQNCVAGRYGVLLGGKNESHGCNNCSIGTYGNVTGAETEPSGCFLCAFGKYSNKIGATNCQNCVAGRYGVLLGGKNESHGCNNCSTGRYGDVSGSPTIEIGCPDFCPLGKYGFKTGTRIASDGCRNCSRGTYGENQNICSICLANTFQNITGQSSCTNCSIGKFTKSIGIQIRTFHDDMSDCLYPPRITSLTPDNTTTQGGINTSLYGEYFGTSNSIIELKVDGKIWQAYVVNSTWIQAWSSLGSGKGLTIEIKIDGIVGTSNVSFSYAPPFIANITSPPLKGGTMEILGKDFVEQGIVVDVYEDGCVRPCSNIQVISDTKLQCQYNGVGIKGENDKKLVIVSVDGQKSNGMYLRYVSDRGELVGVPSNLQRISENSTVEYIISLTLNPNPTVIVKLEASLLNPPTHPSMVCSVSPSRIQFSNMTSQAITVRVGGNRVDEGTDAIAFQCKITHTIESSDPQYKNTPNRYMDVAVVNDDVADVKLWTFDERTKAYGFDVKFIGPVCNTEGGLLKYGVRLETEPTKLVHILPKINMLNTSYIDLAPTIRLSSRMLVFSPSNWSNVQPIIVQSLQDNVDNNDTQFEISHDIVSQDAIFVTKASHIAMSTVFTVTDDDTAGININANVLTIQEDGLAKSITFIGLNTKPVANAEIQIQVDSSLIDVTPVSFVINHDGTAWKSINQEISFRAKNGAASITGRVICSSDDQNYNNLFVKLSIIVQPLLRSLNVPAEGTVQEGQLYTYKLGLTTVPTSLVSIQFRMQGDCTLSTLKLDLYDKTEQNVIVQAPDNFIDEGSNIVSYTCNITHTLNSTDIAYNNQVHVTQVSVLDDDVADVKVAAYSPESNSFLASVNELGPLCMDEGRNITYGIVLESQPVETVYISPSVKYSRGDSPLKIFEPALLKIQPSEWNKTHHMHLTSVHDFIDNDLLVEDFEIHHSITTNDTVFLLTATNPTTSFQITDHPLDVAALQYAPSANVIRLNENSYYRVTASLNSFPRHAVDIQVTIFHAQTSTEKYVSVAPSKATVNSPNEEVTFTVTAVESNYDLINQFTLLIQVTSGDIPYNFNDTFNVEVIDVETRPPTPEAPIVRSEKGGLLLTWNTVKQDKYEIQWSRDRTFFLTDIINATKQVDTALTLPWASAKPEHYVTYFRIRVLGSIGNPNSEWSALTEAWRTTKDCDRVNEYLNMSGGLYDWKCNDCPNGGDCVGEDITWRDVKPMFGYWRIAPWSVDKYSNFSECMYPIACLGGTNIAMRGKFIVDDIDYAMEDSQERCNYEAGYEVNCTRDGDNRRCRLCATCKAGYRHKDVSGILRCDKCPDAVANKGLLALGVLLIVSVMCAMVFDHIGTGGRKSLHQMQKVIIINYLQMTFMIANMDVPWHEPMMGLFDFQGAISTIGEHLLNPVCELQDTSAADLAYGKQVGYALAVPIMIFLIKLVWRLIAWCQGRVYAYRGPDGHSPSLNDGSVATIVFLMYLMYPTLCRQSFSLMVCHKVGEKSYLLVDMQEPCFEGRHLLWFIGCTVPQIILYVIGFPAIGLYAVWYEKQKLVRKGRASGGRKRAHTVSAMQRQRNTMGSSISLFKYGMLYSSYSPNRWYWDAIIGLRKAFIAFLTSYMSLPELEIHFIMVVLVFYMVLNEYGKPYSKANGENTKRGDSLQQLDTLSLLVCLFTAWSGLFFVLYPYCTAEGNLPCYMLMWLVFSVNIGFLVYCALLFRKKVYNAVAQHCCKKEREDSDKQGKGGKVEIEMTRGTTVHTNPLMYRRSFAQIQKTENPYFNSSMTANPASTVARRSTRQSAMVERTSQRLSRLRKVRESQRSQAEESSAKEMSDEDVLEEDMFVDNPMMK